MNWHCSNFLCRIWIWGSAEYLEKSESLKEMSKSDKRCTIIPWLPAGDHDPNQDHQGYFWGPDNFFKELYVRILPSILPILAVNVNNIHHCGWYVIGLWSRSLLGVYFGKNWSLFVNISHFEEGLVIVGNKRSIWVKFNHWS